MAVSKVLLNCHPHDLTIEHRIEFEELRNFIGIPSLTGKYDVIKNTARTSPGPESQGLR